MIPPNIYTELLQVLAFLYRLIILLRLQRRQRRFIHVSGDLILLLGLSCSFFLEYLMLLRIMFKYYLVRRKKKRWAKPEMLIHLMNDYRRNPHLSSFIMSRTAATFQSFLSAHQEQFFGIQNQLLLTMIWLRQYPKMSFLATQFGIPVSCVHRIIHKMIRILHSYLVPKYIKWHSMREWRKFAGFYPEWLRVVAILDCTPFRISKPKGPVQQIYYRCDRHCHFLNWLVIVDLLGFIVLSCPGFLGRAHDSTCLLDINLPVLPHGLQIMADQGFEHNHPVIVLPRANQPQLTGLMRRTFRSRRTKIERCFGILKNSFSSAGTHRFRSRKWISPLIANLSATLYN